MKGFASLCIVHEVPCENVSQLCCLLDVHWSLVACHFYKTVKRLLIGAPWSQNQPQLIFHSLTIKISQRCIKVNCRALYTLYTRSTTERISSLLVGFFNCLTGRNFDLKLHSLLHMMQADTVNGVSQNSRFHRFVSVLQNSRMQWWWSTVIFFNKHCNGNVFFYMILTDGVLTVFA